MSIAELRKAAEERGVELDDVVDALRWLPPPPRGVLSKPERHALRLVGVDPDEHTRSPMIAAQLARKELEDASLTTTEVAELLGRDRSRIRQRLVGPNRSLLGFHRRADQRDWLLPRFQFDLGLHDLDAWALLLRALPQADDTSPVALVAWLTRPRDHLAGRSRAEALAQGYDVHVLAAEASTYGMPA